MAAARYCALVTLDEAGRPLARAMDPFPPEADLTVWLATHRATRKVEEIRRDPRVALYYFHPDLEVDEQVLTRQPAETALPSEAETALPPKEETALPPGEAAGEAGEDPRRGPEGAALLPREEREDPRRGPAYVTLLGEARLVEDPEEKARRWRQEWRPYYPGGPEGEAYLLIQVTPSRLEVVSYPHDIAADPLAWQPAVVQFR